jgi:hypothetical protein
VGHESFCWRFPNKIPFQTILDPLHAQRKIDRMLQEHIRDNKKALYRLGIDYQKAERGRTAELKCHLPNHLQVNIPDP